MAMTLGQEPLLTGREIAEAITPDIEALARGLEYDPKRIFDYVHDHIRYVHYFGSKKGAQLTLLEGSGNDFDQCALLVALFRAAGLSASYQFGTVYMPYETADHRDYHHWVRTTKPNTNWNETTDFVAGLQSIRGFPFFATFVGDTNDLVFHRVWVSLAWNGNTYLLDPAFKVSEPVAEIDLVSAMGLDSIDLWQKAGGNNGNGFLQNLAEATVRATLRDYTTNLLDYIKDNDPNASVDDIMGGQRIMSSADEPLDQGLAFAPYDNGGQWPIQNWDNLPTNLMATLSVTVAGSNQFLPMPQLQGQKLALTFSISGLAQLWLEDALLLQKQTSGGSTVNVVLGVNHPHGSWDFTANQLVNSNRNDQTTTVSYQRTNASYVLAHAFEAGSEWLRKRQERLDQYRQQGLGATSRQVLTETLNVMSLSWLLQTEKLARMFGGFGGVLMQHHHRLGRMAQEAGKGYYIDVYQQMSGAYAATGNSSSDNRQVSYVFDLECYFGSAAEHGIIEQMQSDGLVGASTVKMLQVANALGQKNWIATTVNWDDVRPQLQGYSGDELNLFYNYVYQGYALMLPQNGANPVAGAGSWTGYGMVRRGNVNGYYEMAMIIKGGYNGGYASVPGATVDTEVVGNSWYLQPSFNFDPVALPSNYSGDPVNMANGAFHQSTVDLSIGQTEPRGITLNRTYSSSRRNLNLAGMAPGWVHSYYLRAADVSAPNAVLGETTPAQMAPMIVAARAAYGIYKNDAFWPKNWPLCALIAKWGVDQLITNAVSVILGEDTVQFIKQPNGTFTPPAGSTMTLLRTNGVYWAQERHGRTFKFNGAGLLTNIVDQFNQDLNVTYNTSNWVATVKDWKDRQLTFNYSGTPSRLTSITDTTTPTRSVSYGYTNIAGQLDLISVTDPEGKTSTFLYDTNHQIIATKDALNQVVTSNVYDGFGRVIEQYSQGDPGQRWQFLWSGWENTELDPQESRRVFVYDDKHRLVALQDALTNISRTFYDGQDHVAMTVSPLNETNRFEFDGRHNLLRSVDALNFTNQFFYDTKDNLTRTVDARGSTNRFGYNAQFQLIGTTNGAGDWLKYTHNPNGTLASRVDPAGTTTYLYNTRGQLTNITYPGNLGSEGFRNNVRGDILSHTNGRKFVTSFEYNLRRQLTNTIAPTNITARIAYDAAGNSQYSTDARGFTTTRFWSPTRHLTGTALLATPQGVPVTTNLYDNRDWLTCSLNPLQQPTFFTNDLAGRLVAVTDPLLRATRFGYDSTGRRMWTMNGANETTRQLWNARGNLLQVTDPADHIVQRAYDPAGNQTLLTNRNGKVWQFFFDGANRLTNTVTPLNRQTRLVYNNRGLVQTVIEPSTESANLYYDARGRLTNRTDSVGTVIYRYDANNNRTNVVEAGKTNAWGFDAYDRVVWYRDADGNLIQYRYDANGNLTNLVYPGSKTVAYAYDSLNRLTNVTDWANRKTTLTYDLANRLKSITRPNGTVREMNYDVAGQATNIVEKTASGEPIAFFKFKWNNAARMEWEFAAPLPHVNTPFSRSMTCDDDNRIATFNGQNVVYDLDGNLTTGPLTNDTFVSYTYDARNRLLSAGGIVYGYDPAGSRVAITNGASVTRLVVNPNAALSQVLIRTRADGSKTFYVYGPGLLYEVNETAAGVETGSATYHSDYRGSTVALTDGSGNVTDRVEYSSYGTITYRTGNTDTPFLFNGRYGVQSDPNGLLYMRARYYNPYICRFINADPSGFSGGLNFYAYADGNPVSMLDPFGLCANDGFAWLDAGIEWTGRNIVEPVGGALIAEWKSEMMVRFAILDALERGLTSGGTPGNPNPFPGLLAFFGLRGFSAPAQAEIVAAKSVATPYGRAVQATTPEAQALLRQMQNGGTVYKGGFLGRSETGASQFLSAENPLNAGYAQRYGIPQQNANFDFVLTGKVQPGAPLITRPAPPVPPNPGGALEGVTTPGSFRIDSFYMP